MSTLRLVFGWIFLAAITAAGTFYGLDEVDHRVGLARFHLHEKFGIARFESTPKPPGPPGPPPEPIHSDASLPSDPHMVVPPPSGDTRPTGLVPGPVPGPIRPGPDTSTITKPYKPTDSSLTPVKRPPDSTTTFPPRPGPDDRRPDRPSSTTRSDATVVPPPTPRPVDPTPPRPRDYEDVKSQLIDLSSRADAVGKVWAGRRPSVGTFRPEIQSALTNLRRFVQEAEQALRGGDTASTRRYMDQAEKQMEILKEYD